MKRLVEVLPEPVGRPLAHVPFTLRLGWPYATAVRRLHEVEWQSNQHIDDLIFKQLKELLCHAYHAVPFYRQHYQGNGFHPNDIKTLTDWRHVPVVTKAELQSVALAGRSVSGAKGMKINTGGTSGHPLVFYLDRQAFAREWAHMHFLWKARGYRPQHLKLTFRGKHFDSAKVLRYNAVHNEYVVNASAPMSAVVAAVLDLPRTCVVRWLHGYPSLVAEFAHQVAEAKPEKRKRFCASLFGVLLGSEYPAPAYRSVIEKVLSSNIVSWYGHSEMAILARETAHGVYESFPTYGYAEALPQQQGEDCRLVCTSLHNRVHPFIRYDTGDLVRPICQRAGSLSFRISEGRVGDFVTDRGGRRHSLTAIIFGRHHPAFEHLRHLQVRQVAPGVVTLLATPKDPGFTTMELWKRFDLADLDIDWNLEVLSEPIRTAAGKIRLKVTTEH